MPFFLVVTLHINSLLFPQNERRGNFRSCYMPFYLHVYTCLGCYSLVLAILLSTYLHVSVILDSFLGILNTTLYSIHKTRLFLILLSMLMKYLTSFIHLCAACLFLLFNQKSLIPLLFLSNTSKING